MTRTHLYGDDIVSRVCATQQQLADTDLVVFISRSGEHSIAVVRCKDLRQKCLRRRLSGAAGNRYDPSGEKLARSAGQRHIGGLRVADEHRRHAETALIALL